MKRLWMRLGLVFAVLATGAGGIYVAQRGWGEAQAAQKEIAAAELGDPNESSKTPPKPIPLPGDEGETNSLTTPTLPSDFSPMGPGASSGESSSESSARYIETTSVRPAAQYDSNDGNTAPRYNGASQYTGASQSIGDDTTTTGDDTTTTTTAQPRAASTIADDSGSIPTPPDLYPGETPSAASPYTGRYSQYGSASSLGAPREFEAQSESAANTGAEAELLRPPPGNLYSSADEFAGAAPVDKAAAAPEPLPVPKQTIAQTPAPATQASQRPGVGPQAEPMETSSGVAARVPSTLPDYPSASSALAPALPAATAALASVGAASLALDTPGDRQLEGAQSPSLTLEKKAPVEVSVGQAARFEIIVRNIGQVPAQGVVVTDRVPQGTKLVSTNPQAAQAADGALAWQLGELKPGDQKNIALELMPQEEGEIGSVAQVTFQAQASVRTVSTKPVLTVEHTGPETVLIGEDVVFEIKLTNSGTGAATGLVIEEDVPEGLAHVAGRELEYEVGTLRPKEEKRLQLILKADKAGQVRNLLRVHGDLGLDVADETDLEVLAPQLQVGLNGPKTRYLERQVNYDISVANPGTASAYEVRVVATLSKGLKFIAADNKGIYDPRLHAVYWSLAELPAQESGQVQLTALPVETGDQSITLQGTGNLGINAEYVHVTKVEALTELAFTVQDVHDPIEVGSETSYEIRIVNNGNKAATNVQVGALFPDDLKPLSGEGPTRVAIEGQQVLMDPLEKIAPRDEVVYHVTAQGTRAGDHVIDVQLISDEVPKPVTKQESTKVYSDQ